MNFVWKWHKSSKCSEQTWHCIIKAHVRAREGSDVLWQNYSCPKFLGDLIWFCHPWQLLPEGKEFFIMCVLKSCSLTTVSNFYLFLILFRSISVNPEATEWFATWYIPFYIQSLVCQSEMSLFPPHASVCITSHYLGIIHFCPVSNN